MHSVALVHAQSRNNMIHKEKFFACSLLTSISNSSKNNNSYFSVIKYFLFPPKIFKMVTNYFPNQLTFS